MNTRKFFIGRAMGFLIVLVAALLVAAVHYLAVRRPSAESPSTQSYECNQDGLICPSGLMVARNGPKCVFKACPSQTSIIGILRQDSNGFSLIIEAPTNGQEVSYAMPLILKISNSLKEIVGKKVEVFGSFTEGNIYNVDHLNALPGTASDPTLSTVETGKSAFINGVRITLNSIVSGATTANVTLKSDTDTETLYLNNDKPPHSFDSYTVSLLSIKSGTATFRVTTTKKE